MVQEDLFSTSQLVSSTVTRRQILKIAAGGAALGLGGLMTGFGRFVAAEGTPVATSVEYPNATITAENNGSDYKFGTPDSFPTGYVEITLDNKSDAEHHAMFMKMNSDVTPDQFTEKVKNSANPGDFAALAVSIGGPGSVGPGQKSTVIMNLEEGSYVVICEVPAADGTPHYKMGMITTVEAKSSGTPVTTAPTSETTVDLIDFDFKGLPATLATGKHIWEVTNTGQEPHEMIVERLSPGVTSEAAFAMLTGEATPAASPVAEASAAAGPPFIAVAGAAPMYPGNTVWPVLDLPSGDYVTVCFVPDPKTGKPHVDLGMFGEFSVA